ncbi:MAG: cation:proton antiporter, partial [Chlamydiota bacterium]|nr:cation:proton antiporter [Chlamydiota bacterium]
MHTSSYLSELIIIFLVTTPVVVILQKLRQPAIIGYLLAGILLGPSTFGLVQNLQHIEMMAEVGVMLLLFSIGLEFSLAHLKELKRYIFIGGTLQVGLSIICVFIITRVFGFSIQESLILGFLVSLSSTAIVLKMLFDRGEMDSVQGEVAVGLLLLQDLCVVPMMLIMHSLGRAEVLFWHGILIALLKAALVVSILVISMRYLLPKLLILIARMRNRELFSLCIVLICLGTAWATQKAGLSLALGAFLAGLILAESEYCHYIAAEILPLRNLLSSLFFISIGMLLNVHFVRAFFPAVISMMGVVVLGKGIIIAIIVYMLMRSVRIAILS